MTSRGGRDRRDRHGRATRADSDPHHRPTDGFRTASADRFLCLVHTAISRLDPTLRGHLRDANVRLVDVPPEGAPLRGLDGATPLAVVTFRVGSPADLQVYRRALEMRSLSRANLDLHITNAVRRAVLTALGPA